MTEFLAVISSGSISGAARKLNVERATLSRRMSALEAKLGVRLIHRRTTKLVLTGAGQELHRRARHVVASAEEAWASVRRLDDQPRGLLRVSIAGPHFDDLFIKYLLDFPNVELEILSTSHHIDMLADGVDVAVRIGEIDDENLIAKKISTDRLVAVASPEYLAENGMPKNIAGFKGAQCIVGFAAGWTPSKTWPLLNGKTVEIKQRMTTNEVTTMQAAALSGLGCALLPSSLVADNLENGRLLTILPDVIGKEIPIHLVYVDREYIEPKVRVFIDRAMIVVAELLPPKATNL
ncbi:MAG: LysR family transcriptional regulator [Rhizobiales bacterium]|nr:LysR family transcriptional regulator [Hyphomicrobiales bacterium]